MQKSWRQILLIGFLSITICFSEASISHGNAPPEGNVFVDRTMHDSTTASNRMSKVHISWSYGARFGGPAPGMKKAIRQSGYDKNEIDILAFFGIPSQPYPHRQRGAVTLRVGLDIDVSWKWRSGVHFSKSTPLEVVGSSGVSETVHRRSWEFMMTRVKRPYEKGYTKRTEWALSMGIGLNSLTAETIAPAYETDTQYIRPGVTNEGRSRKMKTGPGL